MSFKDKVLKIIAEENMQESVNEFIAKIRQEILVKLEKEVLENYLKAVENNNKLFVEKMAEFEKNIDTVIENKIKKIMASTHSA